MSDLEQILSDEPISDEPISDEPIAEESPQEEEMAEEAQAPEPEPDSAEEPETEPEPTTVPLAALQEVRGELKATREQLNAMMAQPRHSPQQQPPEPPDILEDPAGAIRHHVSPIEQAMLGQKLQTSRFLAEEKYGEEEVKAAFEYFNQHPEQSQALMAHASPFHAAVKEYQKAKVASEIGSDPDAWIKAQREQIRKEVQAEQVAKSVRETPSAPSLASEPNLGTNAAPQWSGDLSLDDILKG